MKKTVAIAAIAFLASCVVAAAQAIPGMSAPLTQTSLSPPSVIWNFANYQSSPSPLIPNSATSAPVSSNLLRAPRRLFSNGAWWTASGVTITDGAALAPDGTSQASNFVSAGAWSEIYSAFANAPPTGTYTFACTGAAVGSNQTFTFSVSQGSTQTSPSQSLVTTGYARFHWTFTLSGSGATTFSFGGSSAVNANFVDCGLYAGSSDPGEPALGAHLYLGYAPWQGQPAAGTSPALDFNSGFALGQLPSPKTFGTITAIAVVQQTAPPTGPVSFLREATNYGNLWAITQDAPSTSGAFIFGGTSITTTSGMWNISGTGFHVITVRYDGNYLTEWFDDVPVLSSVSCNSSCSSSTGPISPTAIADLLVGATAGFGTGYQIAEIEIWDRGLANAEIYAQVDALVAQFSGLRMSLWPAYVFATGDSIPASTGQYSPPVTVAFPELYTLNETQFGNSSATVGFNFAASGTGVAYEQVLDTYISTILPPASRRGGRIFIMLNGYATNDLVSTPPGGTVSAYAALVGAQCTAEQSYGFNIPVAFTVIDRYNAGSTWVTQANAYNAILTGGSFTACGGYLVNTSGDQFLGFPGSGVATNPLVYYQGTSPNIGVHPLQPGHNIYETYVENELASIGLSMLVPPPAARFYQPANDNYLFAIARGM